MGSRLVPLTLETALDEEARERVVEALRDINSAFEEDEGRYDSRKRTGKVTITLEYEHLLNDGFPSTTQTTKVSCKLPGERGTSRPVRMGRHDGRGPTLELFDEVPQRLPLQTTQD